MNTVIFLGAGASASDGAPVQSDLLREYFNNCEKRTNHGDIERELRTYFWQIFRIDVDSENLDDVQFPTFEEAIGMLDLAEIRNEAFKYFDRTGIASNSGRIRRLRSYLIYAMATVIKEKAGYATWHRCLIKELKSNGLLDQVSIISTNYDILIDNSLAEISDTQNPGAAIDYGVKFTNQQYWGTPNDKAIKLHKIHGSLNWLYCPTCSDLFITPFQKGAAQIAEDPKSATCKRCETLQVPIIIPPTFYKDMSNVHLSNIWKKAENSLRDAEQIIFCGYSFPQADTHIKYMLKRAETNQDEPGFNVKILNWHKNKKPREAEMEKQRFNRFFLNGVTYKQKSFGEFATTPEDFILG